MKFLCVECDSSMALTETRGPENGSMTVVFTCRKCERQIAMLTNAQETQMVHSLGVKIGGRTEAPTPMETIRGSLIGAEENGNARRRADAEDSLAPEGEKCPFSAMVTDGMSDQAAADIQWTEEAEERLKKIPVFVRSMIKGRIEEDARSRGIHVIDAEVMASVRDQMGM